MSPRVVFRPDRDPDRPGDLFRNLTAELGLDDFVVDGDAAGADFVAYVGKERAERDLGGRVRTGPQADGTTYVLPSTAPEHRGRFYEGVWRSFAAHVLGKDLAVRDEYKGMPPEAIKAALDAKRFPFGVLIANLEYDINLGSIIRTANAFLAQEIVIYGRRKTDLRGAMGSYVYETLVHAADLDALEPRLQRYALVCFEQTDDATPLPAFRWPERPLLAFGQEGPGLPEELLARADHKVVIPQHGSIRSLNAGVAAGIAMYDWHSKRGPEAARG